MIALIQGKILAGYSNKVIILTNGGIAYEVCVAVPFFLTLKQGQTSELFTYLKVSENAMELFGFATLIEKHFFELLITVSGVGPKTALNILSLGSLDDIKSAIGRGDVTYLTQVSGIGKKTAERMVVELKNKMAENIHHNTADAMGESLGDVVEALVQLGYSRDEARDVVKELDIEGKTTEELLRVALQRFRK